MVESREKSSRFSPSDFMRARRPELYSDTVLAEKPVLDRAQFEFHLNTLTQRKEEIRFEYFCRRLAEKELCPNLLPQTGPTGGGDSKVDTETYPVAEDISDRWYEGDPGRSSKERWAFAFSAKRTWRQKVKEDIRKIAETGRAYTLIYFITNQAVPDRARAKVEDELHKKWEIEVRILDRIWIIDKVTKNNRWDVVFQTLDIERPRIEPKSILGPLDSERRRNLKELDSLIQDSSRYQGSKYQLVEDCLQAALLARGLGNPRTEIEGRFEQCERIARKRRDKRQLFRILYQRAWTAYWWFDDFAELDRLYREAESLAIDSEWVWDLEKLVNLWQVGTSFRIIEPSLGIDESWVTYTSRLREALKRHESISAKPASVLWARTQLILMDLTDAIQQRDRLPSLLAKIKDVLIEAEGYPDYPVEPVVKIIQELGAVVGGDEAYNKVFEEIIQLQAKRVGKAEQGLMRLTLGFQKLKAGKTYDAIDQFGKAQGLLTQEEHKSEFVQSLVGVALGYEAAGLLWAARANLTVALDRALYEYFKDGQIAAQALPLLKKLIWIEIQLGRVICALQWIEWLGIVINALELDKPARQKFEEEFSLMDAVMGILVLRTRYTDWSSLDRIAGLFERFSLFLSRGAALFLLGYEDVFRSEYGEADGDLDQYFSMWTKQPAANDLPMEAEWHLDKSITMRTKIMGSDIELVTENRTSSILLGEAILAFFESFMSTAIKQGLYSARPYFRIEIRQSEYARTPFIHQVEEDECGETQIILAHPKTFSTALMQEPSYQESLFNLLAEFLRQVQVFLTPESLERLFANERAQDRAFLVARSPLSLTNVLGEKPKYNIRDWIDESLTESLKQLRSTPWKATNDPLEPEGETKSAHFSMGEGQPPKGLFDIDSLKHSDFQILSPINIELWDNAHWHGLGFFFEPGNPYVPLLILLFENSEAGLKIFRGWRKHIGEVDCNEWIGLTLITGIDRNHPAHYRLMISVSEEYLTKRITPKGQLAMISRHLDMTPDNSTNLDRFLRYYGKAGFYRIGPGLFPANQSLPTYDPELIIEKKQLRIIPAWQISPNDPAIMALREEDEPLIPSDVSDPPVLRAKKKLSQSNRKKF